MATGGQVFTIAPAALTGRISRRSSGSNSVSWLPDSQPILHKGHQKTNVRQGSLRFTSQTRVAGQLNECRADGDGPQPCLAFDVASKDVVRNHEHVERKDVRWLLDQLCTDLGFCLPPDEQERLLDSPPHDVDAFTDAVFIAEGLDPAGADKGLHRNVRRRVARAFGDETT